DLMQIAHSLSRDQFSRKQIIQSWQYLLLNLADRDAVICLFSRPFFYRKIGREIDSHCARFIRFLADDLFAKFRQEIIGRETQPEFLSTVKIFARLGRNFADWFAIAGSF